MYPRHGRCAHVMTVCQVGRPPLTDLCPPQGRFTIAAKHHITIAEIYEAELVDIEKVRVWALRLLLCGALRSHSNSVTFMKHALEFGVVNEYACKKGQRCVWSLLGAPLDPQPCSVPSSHSFHPQSIKAFLNVVSVH